MDKFYIGYTGHAVAVRLTMHLADHSGFTAKAKDWIVAYTEQFVTKTEAMQREKQLKAWKSSTRIKELIARSSTE